MFTRIWISGLQSGLCGMCVNKILVFSIHVVVTLKPISNWWLEIGMYTVHCCHDMTETLHQNICSL